MNRYVLIGLAVVVLAGVVALVMSLRSGDGQAEPNANTPERTARAPEPSGDEPPRLRVAERGERPSVDMGESDVVVSDEKIYYRDDGTMVRDHRTGDHEALDKGETARPRGMRKVTPETVVSVRNAIRPHVNGCARQLADSALGDKPMVQGEVQLSIKDNQLTIDELDLQLRDIDESAGESLLDCIRNGVGNLALDATGHPDVERYTLTLPYDIRH